MIKLKTGDVVQLDRGLVPEDTVELTWVGKNTIEFDGGWADKTQVIKIKGETK